MQDMGTIQTNSLVLYKNDVALVTEVSPSGKYTVSFRVAAGTATKGASYSTQSVRAKDIVLLHEGKASSLEAVLKLAEEIAPSEDELYTCIESQNPLAVQIKETHELLLSEEETASAPLAFSELAPLFHGSFSADESWALYCALKHTLFFSEDVKARALGTILFVPRSLLEMEELVKKAQEKGKEAELREAFLARLKEKKLNLPEDAKFMVDVEALALGKSDKSRTMHEAHVKETPERAHKLLLDTGLWPITRNPYPLRWGLSMQSATEGLSHPPEEERLVLPGESYAIDNAWSTDPDDAVAFDGTYVWVHIADPASTVLPDSSIDIAARMRGATLYIPEGAARMLSEDSLADYALGLNDVSRALSFRLTLNEDASIEECAVFKTLVHVKRLTYQEATDMKDSPALKPLFDIASKNIARRSASGAVHIQMPEVHISVSTTEDAHKSVCIEPEVHPESAEMVREMMLLAGEGAARFAFKNRIPFPFVSQDAPTIPQDIPDGLAGQFRLRRCMHRRSVGVTPAMHSGLGLALYSQVTSPLRRYGDLIAHEQLRAFLDKRKLIDKDTMLLRVTAGEESAQAAHQAERKSNVHWKLVFLLQHPEWTGEAVCVDLSGKLPLFCIPSLAMEAFIPVRSAVPLNECIVVRAGNINLPELTVDFCQL